MKKIVSAFLLISLLTALLTSCDYYLEPAESLQTTEAQTTQVTQAQTAAGEQEPKYTNGELTQKLGKELNELFENETYYFKEVTDSFQDEDSDLHVSVNIKDGNNYCSIDTNSADGKLAEGERLVEIDHVVYSLDDAKKQIYKLTGKSIMFDWAKQSYPSILPPIAKYISTSIIEEDGIQLTCETYDNEDEDGKLNYYYEGEKLKRFEFLLLDGTLISSKTIEYSKEIDKSVFELPKDYEIVDVEVGG